MQGGYDIEYALRNVHVTKPSEIQLQAMRTPASRSRRVKLVELIRQSGNPDAIALNMTTGKRTTENARALITRLLRGWNVGEVELRTIEKAVNTFRITNSLA